MSNIRRLGSLTTKVGSGATPRGGKAVYTNEGPAFIRSQNVLDNAMKLEDIARITQEAAQQLKGVTVQPGDVLLNITGDSIARVCVVDPAVLPARVSQHVAIIRTDADLDSRFLQRFLVLPATKEHLLSISDGGTRKALTKAHIERLSVPVPPIHVQRGIAEVLGALDDKIAANAQLVSVADQLASALTRRSLSDSDVVLTDIADITMGSSPPGSSYNAVGDGLVFYQGVRDFGVRVPSNRVWTTEPVRLADVHDTLVSVRAPVGRTNLASERICIGRGLAAVRSTTGHPFTLFHILRDSPDAWAPYEAEGTVFGSINKHQLAGLRVGVAGAGQADRLEQELASMEGRILAALTESDSLAKTRDALLPQLMSGQITVKDAECVVEGAM